MKLETSKPKNEQKPRIIATVNDGPLPSGLVPSSYKKGQIAQLVSSLVSPGNWIRASRSAAKRFIEEADIQLKSIELLDDPKDRSAIYIKYLGPVEIEEFQGVESESDAMNHGV